MFSLLCFAKLNDDFARRQSEIMAKDLARSNNALRLQRQALDEGNGEYSNVVLYNYSIYDFPEKGKDIVEYSFDKIDTYCYHYGWGQGQVYTRVLIGNQSSNTLANLFTQTFWVFPVYGTIQVYAHTNIVDVAIIVVIAVVITVVGFILECCTQDKGNVLLHCFGCGKRQSGGHGSGHGDVEHVHENESSSSGDIHNDPHNNNEGFYPAPAQPAPYSPPPPPPASPYNVPSNPQNIPPVPPEAPQYAPPPAQPQYAPPPAAAPQYAPPPAQPQYAPPPTYAPPTAPAGADPYASPSNQVNTTPQAPKSTDDWD